MFGAFFSAPSLVRNVQGLESSESRGVKSWVLSTGGPPYQGNRWMSELLLLG